jgi:uncharacterized protein YcbX
MSNVIEGRVHSLWRYPVKSMAGEEVGESFLGTGGVRNDRLYAFHSSRAQPDFPYLTAREEPVMLLYRPRCCESTGPQESSVLVESPTGEQFAIHDPRLLAQVSRGAREGEIITLLHSERALADAHPVSLFSIQTVQQLGRELGRALDPRRFRANIYLDLGADAGFAEDEFLGRKLQIGPTAVVEVIERDKRCKMITLDPETSAADHEVMRQIARAHDSCAGIYGAVRVEGLVKRGDQIALLS